MTDQFCNEQEIRDKQQTNGTTDEIVKEIE